MKKALQARKDAGEKLTAEEEEQLTEAKKFPLAHLFADKKTTITTIALTIMTSVQNFGYYGIMVWLPMILLKEHGLTTKSMSGWMIVTVIGMIAGIFVFGWLCDRLGRKKPYLLFYVCAAAMVYIYVNLGTPIALLFGGAFLGFLCNGMMAGYGTLLSENYTTDARSTAQNFIFNTGRAVGGFAPVIIGSPPYILRLLSMSSSSSRTPKAPSSVNFKKDCGNDHSSSAVFFSAKMKIYNIYAYILIKLWTYAVYDCIIGIKFM